MRIYYAFNSLASFETGFYNRSHPERLTGLLRKISNEIIHRCCARISLEDVFDGDVEGSMVDIYCRRHV